MERIPPRVWRLPDRLSLVRARLVIGLSATMFVIAGLGLWVYDGRQALLSTIMFLSIGLSNLAWGVGSLLADERRSRAVRVATLPIGIVMFVAMFLYGALILTGWW